MEELLRGPLLSTCPPWALVAIAAFLVALGVLVPRYRMMRAYLFSISALLGVTAGVSIACPGTCVAVYILAIVPASLIAQHAVYLAYIKNPFSNEGRALGAIANDFLPNRIQNGLNQARQTSERDFGWSTLGFRFGVPAVLVVVIISCFATLLYSKTSPQNYLWSDDFALGARYGGAGAYVYVLLYLSRRNFRHDITSNAAVWSAVDLVVGPLLGGIVALLWRSQGTAGGFASSVVFFACGLAPKHVASVLEEAAKRLLRADDKSMLPAPRTRPLTMLRGITPSIAERLEEAGVEDVFGMAMADPARLMRNTPFDQRQIVSWIDEAILITAFPSKWETLEALGVTGAIDVAWYYDIVLDGEQALVQSERDGSGTQTAPPELAALAKAADLELSLLWGTAQRLYWDGQVQVVWVLYQIGSEGVQPSEYPSRSAHEQTLGVAKEAA
jgi:hypothetical protein